MIEVFVAVYLHMGAYYCFFCGSEDIKIYVISSSLFLNKIDCDNYLAQLHKGNRIVISKQCVKFLVPSTVLKHNKDNLNEN